jgi:uncharacterized metal-binding protein YceD (DUF177 family)
LQNFFKQAVKYLSKYEIAFKGLKEGIHQFDYELDDTFFEKFENSEVKKGSVKATVLLTKQSTLMILNFTVKGSVELLCDCCLDQYNQKINNEGKLFVKFGLEEEELSDEIIVISFEDHQLNVAQFLYELIILGLPIKHVHPNKNGKSTCDPEMIKKLGEYLVKEESVNEEEPVDERWNELKKLLDNK